MIIKYHGKLCEIDTTLEDGAEELDIYTKNINLEDTLEFPSKFLETTTSTTAEEEKNTVKEDVHE